MPRASIAEYEYEAMSSLSVGCRGHLSWVTSRLCDAPVGGRVAVGHGRARRRRSRPVRSDTGRRRPSSRAGASCTWTRRGAGPTGSRWRAPRLSSLEPGALRVERSKDDDVAARRSRRSPSPVFDSAPCCQRRCGCPRPGLGTAAAASPAARPSCALNGSLATKSDVRTLGAVANGWRIETVAADCPSWASNGSLVGEPAVDQRKLRADGAAAVAALTTAPRHGWQPCGGRSVRRRSTNRAASKAWQAPRSPRRSQAGRSRRSASSSNAAGGLPRRPPRAVSCGVSVATAISSGSRVGRAGGRSGTTRRRCDGRRLPARRGTRSPYRVGGQRRRAGGRLLDIDAGDVEQAAVGGHFAALLHLDLRPQAVQEVADLEVASLNGHGQGAQRSSRGGERSV